MQTKECPNCGNAMLENEKECKYCGQPNPIYRAPSPVKSFIEQQTKSFTETHHNYNEPEEKDFSMGIFILLLIFFWPAALVYVFIKKR